MARCLRQSSRKCRLVLRFSADVPREMISSLEDKRLIERNLARADAIGAWVCAIGLLAAVVLVVVYALRS